MSITLTKVGALVVRNSSSITSIRKKIAGVSRLVGFSEVDAARLATSISEITRRLLSTNINANIGIYLNGIEAIGDLVLSFPDNDCVTDVLRASAFFELKSGTHDDGSRLILALKSLRGRGATLEELMLSQIREMLSVQSREELMEELHSTNEELETHKVNLERTVAERTASLSDKEAQLRMALDNMPGAMFVVDAELNIVLMNDTYKDYYGDADGMLDSHTSMRDLLKAEIKHGIVRGEGSTEEVLAERVKSFGTHSTLTFEDRTMDGRDIQLTRTPAPDGHTVSVAVDITERKLAERDLAKQRQVLETVLDNTAQAILAVDANYNLIASNKRFQDFLKLPDELVVPGTSVLALVQHAASIGFYGEGDTQELVDSRMAALTSGKPLSDEISTTDGLYWYCTLLPSPSGGFVMSYTDTTERKLAENKLSNAYDIISSSIAYASRIQRSILPDSSMLASHLSDYFVLWEPRDVVGGDVYWCRSWGDGFLIILGDCTGHGVPGAFMTLIATGVLDKALTEIPAGQVGKLLQRINQLIQFTLGQDTENSVSDDGMELGMCYLQKGVDELLFSGARFELFVIENGEITVTKGTKSGIGYHGIPHDLEFDEHKIDNLASKVFYMTSDGLIDQVGGERERMYGKKRFRDLLLSIQGKPMADQKMCIYQAMLDFMGEQNRRDDVAAIGFRA